MMALKQLIKSFLYRPRLGSLGYGSYVKRPYRLSNKTQIHIGKNVSINSYTVLSPFSSYNGYHYNGKIIIGDDVYIGRYVQIFAVDEICFGLGCVLSDYVYVSDSSHGFDPTQGLIMRQALSSKGQVKIGANCFLGIGVIVMSGVTLGDWCIVGAGSIVTRSFPPYSMIAGSPARTVKRYCSKTNRWVAGREIE
jgi:acetyltransferase-like isoleucine patch superfamily enzyme